MYWLIGIGIFFVICSAFTVYKCMTAPVMPDEYDMPILKDEIK